LREVKVPVSSSGGMLSLKDEIQIGESIINLESKPTPTSQPFGSHAPAITASSVPVAPGRLSLPFLKKIVLSMGPKS
jgi:hypothetical protein